MSCAARIRAWLVAATATTLVLAACGTSEEGAGPDPSESAGSESASSSPSPDEPSATAAYELHSVEPPDPAPGVLYGDDMLVIGPEAIPEDVIAEIEAIRVKGEPAIAAAEVLSVGNAAVEGEVYDVAAVDLPGYRRFTPIDSAQFAEGWDRIAGGELAADRALQGVLPLDDKGYLSLGSGEEAYLLHEGAYLDLAAGMEIVVNDPWGEVLGLPQDNALLISTGTASPQRVRPKLEKILGEDYSIQDLDIVEEFGLDPDAFALVRPVGSFGDAVGVFRYRPLEGGRVAPDPEWVASHIVTEQVPILGELTCNKHMMPQLKAALIEVQESGLADEIRYHVGCYYPRFIAGSTKLSNHSFGLAIDINSRENQRGTVGEMHRGVVAIFKKWGFAWGGDWNYTDPMHFELSRIVNPG